MIVESVYRGPSFTEVTVKLAKDRPVSDDLVIGWAMAHLGETPSRLYGWRVRRAPDRPLVAIVTLNTD